MSPHTPLDSIWGGQEFTTIRIYAGRLNWHIDPFEILLIEQISQYRETEGIELTRQFPQANYRILYLLKFLSLYMSIHHCDRFQ